MKHVSWDEDFEEFGSTIIEQMSLPSRRRKIANGKEPQAVHISALGKNGLLGRALRAYEVTVRAQVKSACPHKKINVKVGKLPVYGTHVEFEKLLSEQKSE